VLKTLVHRRLFGYIAAPVIIGAATVLLKIVGGHVNPTTVALVLLLLVLFVATAWGSKPAILASLLGVACFNFFFLPPFGTFIIAEPENWIAFIAFMITAITVGQLSARAKQRAEEADKSRQESERLFKELQDSFEQASRAKALEQSERLKSALLDAVTHDLRTPLTSIKASITTLLDEVDGNMDNGEPITLDKESRREMLTVINEESDRLGRFIGGLIDLARIEAGEMHLRRSFGAVEEIIGATLSRAESLTRQHHLLIDLDPNLPVACIDSRAISEVIYTLIDNATKYSLPGSTIRIGGERVNEELRIVVEDEGRGIAPELRDRVFDKFFRAIRDGDISTHEPSGTGMGLAIAKGIIEAHDGRIWIENKPIGKGTRVVFTLPIGDSEENPKPSKQHGLN
jgi:two-component system sensor histidine kinase KdpD